LPSSTIAGDAKNLFPILIIFGSIMLTFAGLDSLLKRF
jgi:hypothetical protein